MWYYLHSELRSTLPRISLHSLGKRSCLSVWAAMNNMACTPTRGVCNTFSLGWLLNFSGYGNLHVQTQICVFPKAVPADTCARGMCVGRFTPPQSSVHMSLYHLVISAEYSWRPLFCPSPTVAAKIHSGSSLDISLLEETNPKGLQKFLLSTDSYSSSLTLGCFLHNSLFPWSG